MRPLGVASLEDKIVQRAVVEVLNAVFEADFLGFSYGFRPGRGPHRALDALTAGIQGTKVSWVLDADIRDFFGSLDRSWLEKFLRHRIADEKGPAADRQVDGRRGHRRREAVGDGAGNAAGRGMRGRCCCTRSRAGRCREGPGRRRAGGPAGRRPCGAAVGGQHVLRAGRGHDRAVQAPGRREAGPLAGLGALPGLRTLRPELAAIADAATRWRCRRCSRPRCWPRTR